MTVILASSSPRRKELLELIGLEPEVIVPAVDEERRPKETIQGFLQRVCLEKGRSVYRDEFYDVPVVSADTIVTLGDTVLGKPRDRRDAFVMLKKLSGRMHRVITGVGILYQGKSLYDHASTRVYFSKISDQEIEHYLDCGDYRDKAGAYGIQGKASLFVEKIDGCYFNVMGFPLNLFYTMLKKIGIDI